MTEDFYVHIIDDRTNESVKVMGPETKRRAEKIADGVMINLDHENYCVRIDACGHEIADATTCLLCAAGEKPVRP